MRLGTVEFRGRARAALAEGDEAVRLLPEEAGDVVGLISQGRAAIQTAAQQGQSVPLGEVRMMAPIQRFSRDVLCTGWNYWDHFEESRGKREGQDVDRPRAPTFFTKSPHAVIGPYDDVAHDPHISAKWDYEAEVGLVIGRKCRNLTKSNAHQAIFGYFLANDTSQRDLQRRHGGQWLKGKSIDGTTPIGPWITTPHEVEIEDVQLELELNGSVMQSASLRQMAFPIEELLAELSFGMTLMPGDIVITGTPAGIGNAREPQIFLKPGDEMVVRATGLGELRNRVVAADLHEGTDVQNMSEPS
ncbi:2-keto-4-pentenoate hydratase/2-oxohepta-3-ene-1,7-dioic acid hydratase (catechol pathway) [Paracoccus halophilus]|uniref:2-keto-4-pentenoate hydratase/2-oxohepta-3-ene-1,7-dioic acid hydratase (Catechol pathway) n=1 Tax=Paracoccus halophilus TaxID=376733 RepID=A0A099EUT7_9RHOB|nr:fumarylacetoacetate hydrolase family protein [Paracoccus halophilus]KGJ01767.1 5-carboxymethyl-2-hydroxymuconate isomerase [Paracoccus halophilus]SFA52671.1 2-keto-4-pentenoate hydratase/2-oxohepta-3-ene-1,7-dioic acid hydratase (catechol pathway) [Paracoccus halophilus]